MAVSAGVLGVFAVPASVDVSASTTTLCTGVPDGLTLVVPHGRDVALVRSGGVEPLGITLPAPARTAMRGPDGTVWAEVAHDDGTVEIYRVPPGGEPALEWRWPQEGDEFDDPSGVVVVTYRWDGTAPVGDVALPEVLLVTNGCAG